MTDRIIVIAAESLESVNDWRPQTAETAWRLAFKTWLPAHEAIRLTQERVSPVCRPQPVPSSAWLHTE